MHGPRQTKMERALRHVPDFLWGPVAAALLTAVLGAFSVIVGNAGLLPALGGTIFHQSYYPTHDSARFYNVLAGQGIGLVSGIVGLVTSGALAGTAMEESARLRPEEAGAAIIAVTLVLVAQRLVKAVHPPAVVTALLIAVGILRPSIIGIGVIVSAIALVATAGEALRQARVRSCAGSETGRGA